MSRLHFFLIALILLVSAAIGCLGDDHLVWGTLDDSIIWGN